MDEAKATKDANEKLWNTSAGQAWVESQEMLDRMYRPIEELLRDAVDPREETRVLDVGCGAGSTTLAVARKVGPGGSCVGVDISEPMISAGSERARRENLRAVFIRADAETYPFNAGEFDAVMSRFGVMFFADEVRAAANLRRACRAGAPLRFVVWRSAGENPFMTAAEEVAAPLLPNLAPRDVKGPGQFALGDPDRVKRMLEGGGWERVELRKLDVMCRFRESELLGYLTRLGPVGRALGGVDEETRARVVPVVRAAFERFVEGEEVGFNAACWWVEARNPG